VLIKHGAAFDHVSALGWSPLFYCWTDVRKSEASFEHAPEMANMIKLLNDNCILDSNETDAQDWTAIERACAYGRSSDLQVLQALGMNFWTLKGPLQSTIIHIAVYSGNWETYSWLCKQHGNVKAIEDARGWSLLHFAAQLGRERIMGDLIQQGVDFSLKTQPSRTAMRSVLHDRECTAEEVAKAYGPKKYQAFLKIVREFGVGGIQILPYDRL
jgi:ankyrin repeat protein